jgi:hypothetical protein
MSKGSGVPLTSLGMDQTVVLSMSPERAVCIDGKNPDLTKLLGHFSHRYALADDVEEQLSLMESSQNFRVLEYTCARNALIP